MDFHGYSNLTKATRRLQVLFWAVVITASALLALAWSTANVMRYFDFQRSASLTIELPRSISMPEVQICSNVVLDARKVAAQNISQTLIDQIDVYFRHADIVRQEDEE